MIQKKYNQRVMKVRILSMSKISIETNKNLKLINVLIRKKKMVKVIDLYKEITKYTNFLSVAKIQTRGPLITRQYNSQMDENGILYSDFDLMVQTTKALKTNSALNTQFQNSLNIPNCLYSKFKGAIEDIEYVQSKMKIHIWEENLIDSGEEYMVYLENSQGLAEIDLFKPIA